MRRLIDNLSRGEQNQKAVAKKNTGKGNRVRHNPVRSAGGSGHGKCRSEVLRKQLERTPTPKKLVLSNKKK